MRRDGNGTVFGNGNETGLGNDGNSSYSGCSENIAQSKVIYVCLHIYINLHICMHMISIYRYSFIKKESRTKRMKFFGNHVNFDEVPVAFVCTRDIVIVENIRLVGSKNKCKVDT